MNGVRRTLRRASAATAFILSLGLGLPVMAQTALTVDEIRDCLCREQALNILRGQTDGQRLRFNDAQADLKKLEDQIANMRKTMNPDDELSVQIMVEMIRRRDALNAELRDKVGPETQAAVAKLNQAVADYNARCAQRTMLKMDVETASRNLVCPVQ
ncbi:MAG: hypothetical protein ACOY3L_00505 [Pseudomonadota bacterium]